MAPAPTPGLSHDHCSILACSAFYGRAAGAINPRLRELMEFAVAVSTHDAIAPPGGQRGLRDYFCLLSNELENPVRG